MHANEPHHNGHNTSDPQLLLPNPTVTIRFDGLIYTAYDKGRRLYQAAVHSVNEDHHLTIEVTVTEGGNSQELPIPNWNPEYAGIKANGPFWLYVDSGNGLQPREFSAKLYLPDDPDERSFDNILNFESLYGGRKITLDPGKFVEFNFPHGTCYSAKTTKANKKKVDGRGRTISDEGDITVSRIGAIDIDWVSEKGVKREIVLMNKNNDKVFNFPLENGKHYLINIQNQPKDHENNGMATHFLRYYDLFPLNGNEQQYLVSPKDEEAPNLAGDIHSPPCISGSGDRINGLP